MFICILVYPNKKDHKKLYKRQPRPQAAQSQNELSGVAGF